MTNELPANSFSNSYTLAFPPKRRNTSPEYSRLPSLTSKPNQNLEEKEDLLQKNRIWSHGYPSNRKKKNLRHDQELKEDKKTIENAECLFSFSSLPYLIPYSLNKNESFTSSYSINSKLGQKVETKWPGAFVTKKDLSEKHSLNKIEKSILIREKKLEKLKNLKASFIKFKEENFSEDEENNSKKDVLQSIETDIKLQEDRLKNLKKLNTYHSKIITPGAPLPERRKNKLT